MAPQQASPPATDAEQIDAIGVDVVSKALDKGESTVRRWRSRGVPKKYQAAFAKLVEKERQTPNQVEALPAVETAGRIKQILDGINLTQSSPSALPGDLGPSADDQEAPEEHVETEDAAADVPQDRSVETESASDIEEQGASSARQRRRRAKRQHATAADPSRAGVPHQQTGPTKPVIERSAAPSAPPIAPTAIEHKKMPVRLNRQTAIFACVALASAISIGLAQGLRQASSVPSETEPEQPQISQPPARAILPNFSYVDVTRPQAPAVTKAALAVADDPRKQPEAEPATSVEPATSAATATQSGAPVRDQRDAEEEAALQSGLFPAGAPTSSGATPVVAPQGQDEALAALDRLRQNLPTPQDLLPQGQPSAGDQQESFLNAQLDDKIYLKNGLQKPLSDYEVKAGTIIPAALITGLNSDLPGEIIGQVTEHVYDTASGQHLLIPQGAKILGRYNAQVSYGQERAQLVWDRLILPNGDSVQLEAMVGTDKAGYAGLVDEVDHHFGQLVGAVILSSFISVGANLATDSNGDVTDALGDAAAQQAAEIGGEIVDRQLDIQPTITVRPGFKLNILVNKDMILEPYPAG